MNEIVSLNTKLLGKEEKALLREMFEVMKERLTDDLYERYGEIIRDVTTIRYELWVKDVDAYVSLCQMFGIRVSKKKILQQGQSWFDKREKRDLKH